MNLNSNCSLLFPIFSFAPLRWNFSFSLLCKTMLSKYLCLFRIEVSLAPGVYAVEAECRVNNELTQYAVPICLFSMIIIMPLIIWVYFIFQLIKYNKLEAAAWCAIIGAIVIALLCRQAAEGEKDKQKAYFQMTICIIAIYLLCWVYWGLNWLNGSLGIIINSLLLIIFFINMIRTCIKSRK